METLGNLTFVQAEVNTDTNKFYWDCHKNRYEIYPLYKRYIKCEVTELEFIAHKKEISTDNCYYCKHTKNGVDEGTLECTSKDSSLLSKKVNNLTICKSFEKISEILDD